MPSRLSSAEMIMEHLLEDPSLREEENMHHDSPVLYEQE